jgi:hypothetical protein
MGTHQRLGYPKLHQQQLQLVVGSLLATLQQHMCWGPVLWQALLLCLQERHDLVLSHQVLRLQPCKSLLRGYQCPW